MLAASSRVGPYEIVAPLGSGGMGEVYRARDTRLGRDVALKVLPEPFANDPDRLARFEREARAVATLSHPNILAIHDYGTHEAITYAAVELLEGETLGARLLRGPLNWREAAEIGAAVADGLAAAHAKGVIHRDIKPDNLFLTADGRLKILDFGLARVTSADECTSDTIAPDTGATAPGTVVGTVEYMSPEQIRGETIGPWSDIFSLGCVLHEMVTGRRVFGRNTNAETLAAILRDEPPSASEAAPRPVPAEFGRIIRHCLEKDPAARFHSAHDLALALRQLSSGSESNRFRFVTQIPRAGWVAGVLAVAVLAAAIMWREVRTSAPAPREGGGGAIGSLAVLPLVNASGDPDMEFLGDGIAEGLINRLSQLPNLRVMARTTVFRYKDKAADPQGVGKALGVEAVLAGRVTRRGDVVAVQLDLVSTSDGTQLWGEQFRLAGADLDTFQQDAPTQIAGKLRLQLTGEQAQRLSKRYTESTEAYQFYLRGRYLQNHYSERMRTAIEYFDKAIAIDPSYALAYSGLSDAWSFLGNFNYVPPAEAYRRARTAALKALELDEELADAHVALALIRMNHDWDWQSAERDYQRALALNPGYAPAHSGYAWLLAAQGRLDPAIARMRRTIELDPLSVKEQANFGWYFYMARRYDEAVAQLLRTLQMDSEYAYTFHLLGRVYEQQTRHNEAIAQHRRAVEGSDRGSTEVAGLAYAYAVANRVDEARMLLNELRRMGTQKYVSPYNLAVVHAGLGETDAAFAWLEKAYAQRDGWLAGHVNVDPRFDRLRSDPRFEDLLRRLGLR